MDSYAFLLHILYIKNLVYRNAYLFPALEEAVQIISTIPGQYIIFPVRAEGAWLVGGGNQLFLLQPEKQWIQGAFSYILKPIFLELYDNLIPICLGLVYYLQDTAFQYSFHKLGFVHLTSHPSATLHCNILYYIVSQDRCMSTG